MDKFYPVKFSTEDIEFCVEMGLKRNEAKTNQTVSRGWPPKVKHIMGVHAEYADQKYLNATMDWGVYGKKGDRARPDGILPDGRKIIAKSVGKTDMRSIWIPKDCLDNAENSDVVIAFQVIPVEQAYSTYTYTQLGFLGWLSVDDYLRFGEISEKHYEAAESLPGRKLKRDICCVTPKTRLYDIRDLAKQLGISLGG